MVVAEDTSGEAAMTCAASVCSPTPLHGVVGTNVTGDADMLTAMQVDADAEMIRSQQESGLPHCSYGATLEVDGHCEWLNVLRKYPRGCPRACAYCCLSTRRLRT